MFTGAGVFIWQASGRSLGNFIDWNMRDAALGCALGAALIATATVFFRAWPDVADRLVRMQAKHFGFLGKSCPNSAVVWLSICAGVGEEVLFRGGIQTLLNDNIGPHFAILAASLIFAFIHFATPIISAIIFGIGMLFGYVFWATDSLLLVMVAHIVYDVFAIAHLRNRLQELGWADAAPNH